FGCDDRNRVRAHMGVDGVAQRVGSDGTFEIDMRDLTQRMDAGIGAAGGMNLQRGAAKTFDAGFDDMLHGEAVRLRLPADERRAVIFDGELVARHQARLSPGLSGKPRRNSRAPTGDLPARWTSLISSAPCPQATRMLSPAEST